MNILCIDGGGIRGAYSAYLLHRIQEEFDVNFAERFDLIAGTSTGSIIAAALATGINPKKIVDLYDLHGEAIFPQSMWVPGAWRSARKLFGSSYSNTVLRKVLSKQFGKKTLSQTITNLILPATNIGEGVVHVLKSNYDREFVRDPDVKIVDAVLASCAAPTFFDPHKLGPYLLADGGLWANNPSLVSIVDAKRRFAANIDDIRVLSIGTGSEEFTYSQKKSRFAWLWRYGLVWWRPKKLIDLLLSLQSQTSSNMAFLLLQDRYLRINFSGKDLSLDDPKTIAGLKSRADYNFTHLSPRIRGFFESLPARRRIK